ncbi:FliM/FliN family flagellar motor switch protein [Sphingomonas sp. DT-204]|uniref:FliM/FliN family flagellar motor switch protein n=1 Tax=Sphingomonas sp. DT-204 TaxID=3396166 RepID=UPI003F1CCDA1
MTSIKADPSEGGSEVPKAESTPRTTLAARLVDTVEVVLEAYVGEARLTVAELGALRPGTAVTLDAALNRAVELRLNGVMVARGELVAVGDNFGVRLTEIAE